MITRRKLITKLIGTLCAIPMVGKLFGQNMERKTKMQHSRREMEHYSPFPYEYSGNHAAQEHFDKTMGEVAECLTERLSKIMHECAEDDCRIGHIQFSWIRIPDRYLNPYGDMGQFRIVVKREHVGSFAD